MNVKYTYNSDKYRKTARNLLTEVSKLVKQAGKTVDTIERRELYLQAMNISEKAYNLLGKARKVKGESHCDARRN
jgi:hypothetical protein